jgi:hypothetical protein
MKGHGQFEAASKYVGLGRGEKKKKKSIRIVSLWARISQM